jgi:hypothetical protein
MAGFATTVVAEGAAGPAGAAGAAARKNEEELRCAGPAPFGGERSWRDDEPVMPRSRADLDCRADLGCRVVAGAPTLWTDDGANGEDDPEAGRGALRALLGRRRVGGDASESDGTSDSLASFDSFVPILRQRGLRSMFFDSARSISANLFAAPRSSTGSTPGCCERNASSCACDSLATSGFPR